MADPLTIGMGLASLFGFGGGKKKDPASKGAEALYGQQAQQAQLASQQLAALLAPLFQQAGYNYNAGTPAVAAQPGRSKIQPGIGGRGFQVVPGSPGVAAQPAGMPTITPMGFQGLDNISQTAMAQQTSLQDAMLQKIRASMAAQNGAGRYTQQGLGAMEQRVAEGRQGTARDLYLQQEDRQRAMLGTILNLLQGQMQAGQGAASGLMEAGRYNQARNDQSAAAQIEMIANAIAGMGSGDRNRSRNRYANVGDFPMGSTYG